jgi:hypothetical protein
MALPSNPQTLASYDITKGEQAKIFVKKVSDLFLSLATQAGLQSILSLTATYLSGILNGSGLITDTALTRVTTNLGSVSTNQTVPCTGATCVFVSLTITAALTLNLTFLDTSVPVYIRCANVSGGPLVFKIAGTNAAGSAFTSVLAVFSSGTGEINMSVAGFSVVTGSEPHFTGQANASNLFLMSL